MLTLMSFRAAGAVAAVIVAATLGVTSTPVCSCRSEVAAAIAALRAINSAQQWYAHACGSGRFAVDLADLAAPPAEGANAFIGPDLDRNGVIKDGYAVTLTIGVTAGDRAAGVPPATCRGAVHPPAASYFATAVPVGTSADRPFFATDARGIIYRSPKPIANPIQPGPDVVALR